jgi:hypothetical protein
MVNVSGIAGTTMGIMGMGIGLTLLAKTASDIANINSRTMRGQPMRRPRTRSMTYKPKPMKFNPPSFGKRTSIRYKPKLSRYY